MRLIQQQLSACILVSLFSRLIKVLAFVACHSTNYTGGVVIQNLLEMSVFELQIFYFQNYRILFPALERS